MAKSPAFAPETQKSPIVVALNTTMIDNGGTEDWWWESEDDRFVSCEALLEGADAIDIVITRAQLQKLLGKGYV